MPTKLDTRLDWRTHPPAETPLQRNAFLDACTAWLTRAPEPDEVADDTLRTPTAFVASIATTATPDDLAYAWDDLRTGPLACATCGAAASRDCDYRLVMANPFAQRPLIVVCPACDTHWVKPHSRQEPSRAVRPPP